MAVLVASWCCCSGVLADDVFELFTGGGRGGALDLRWCVLFRVVVLLLLLCWLSSGMFGGRWVAAVGFRRRDLRTEEENSCRLERPRWPIFRGLVPVLCEFFVLRIVVEFWER